MILGEWNILVLAGRFFTRGNINYRFNYDQLIVGVRAKISI
jgi:hypothetical protein